MLIILEIQISKQYVVGYGFESNYDLTEERYSLLFFVIKHCDNDIQHVYIVYLIDIIIILL